MIRSRSIPAVLSRVAGDGIHAILLIDANGELLGSHGSPPPRPPKLHINNNGGGSSSAAMGADPGGNDEHWPLDAASIGALISEVAGDYRRMGEELLLLDPEYDLFQKGSSLHRQDSSNDGGGGDGGVGSTRSGGGGANGKDKSGTNLKTLVIELDYVSACKQNVLLSNAFILFYQCSCLISYWKNDLGSCGSG